MQGYSRKKRVKTDYAKKQSSNHSFIAELREHLKTPARSSSLSNNRESILTQVFKEIKHEVNYQGLSTQKIVEEREMLKKKVKEMHSALARVIENQMLKRAEEERIKRKASVGREMGLTYNQLCREFVQNTHKIKTMEEQFKQSNEKLILLSSPDSKISLVRKVAQVELKVKQLKEQLGRIKKNKFLREREIVKGGQNEREEVSSLQLQYINLAKKQEYLFNRTQKVQQELADIDFNLIKQRDYYQQLRQECQQIEKNQPNPAVLEHLKFLYQSSRKKLEQHLKRNQRDEQTKKRKYYNLLVEYQHFKKKGDELEMKIEEKEELIEKTNEQMRQLLDEVERVREDERRKKDLFSGFMITEVSKNRIALDSRADTPKQYYSSYQDSNFDKKSKGSLNGYFVRRWNSRVQGSIVKQHSVPHNISEIDQVLQDEGSRISIKKSRLSKGKGQVQTRHIQTQTSPTIDYEQPLSFLQSGGEQLYPSDFQV